MLSFIGVTAIWASAYLRLPLLICIAAGMIWACLGYTVVILLGVAHKVLIGLAFAILILHDIVSSRSAGTTGLVLVSAILLILLAALGGWMWCVGVLRAISLTRAMFDSRSMPAVIGFMSAGAALAVYGISNAADILAWTPVCSKD